MKFLTVFIILVVVLITKTSTKDNNHLKKKLHRKLQVHHKLNLQPDLHTSRHHHIKKFKDKSLPQDCTIICPCVFPSYGSNFYPYTPATSVTRHQTKTTSTTTPSDSDEDDEESTEESSEEPSEEVTDLPSNTTKRSFATNTSLTKSNATNIVANKTIKASRRMIRRKIYRLTNSQKRVLLKKVKLTNRRHKKDYKFRDFNPLLCGIECVEEYEQPNIEPSPFFEPPTYFEQPQSSENSDEDDSDYDSYEEGEDTPIEETVKPFVPNNPVVGGVKPFGPVDFIGFDDFGPDGGFALEPEPYFEDKSHRKHKNKKGKNKNRHHRT